MMKDIWYELMFYICFDIYFIVEKLVFCIKCLNDNYGYNGW